MINNLRCTSIYRLLSYRWKIWFFKGGAFQLHKSDRKEIAKCQSTTHPPPSFTFFPCQVPHSLLYNESVSNVPLAFNPFKILNHLTIFSVPTSIISSLYCSFYNKVRYFCLKLKISLTTELLKFAFLSKLHLGLRMVLGSFTFRFKF